jgi:hypothetical protein
MDIKRILSNNVSILVGQTNTGKTMLLADMMVEYTKTYTSQVYCFGLKKQITDKLYPDIVPFNSVLEMERIRDSIIFVDEVGALFDLDNRKQARLIDHTFRHITHQNNKIVLSGLPTDFKKFLSAKADCFMFTSLTISDLINRSETQVILKLYKGEGVGSQVLHLPVGEVLCWSRPKGNKLELGFWIDTFKYYKKFDTKRKNSDLFQKKV